MRKILFLSLLILACTMSFLRADRVASPYFSIRSQGVDAAREMVGIEEYINLCDQGCLYGAFTAAAEYTQSFKPNHIARCLFGNDVTSSKCNTALTISGSLVADRDANDWLADYFGLPTDFQSTVSFKPSIKNAIIDLNLYVGNNRDEEGCYFRVNMPLTYTRWDLNAREKVQAEGSNDYNAGYFTGAIVPREDLLDNALAFFRGGQVPTLDDLTTFHPLAYSRWGCDRTKTRFADIELVFGRNLWCDEDGFFGISLRAEAPTGNKPQGVFLFEPIAGNGGHWTLGGGISTAGCLWRDDTCDRSLKAYLDVNVVHLFRTCQTRSFDLCGKPNSRYMLAEKMMLTNPTYQRIMGNYAPSSAGSAVVKTTSLTQFSKEFAPIANLTARTVDVSAAVQGDLALKFAYTHGNGITCDLGYNLWGRTREKIVPRAYCTPGEDITQWALKGDAQVYGFSDASPFSPVPLGATQSQATIHSGTNIPASSSAIVALKNPAIDHPLYAVFNEFAVQRALNDQPTTYSSDTHIKTSIQPVTLQEADINLNGTKALSNKLFGHINYAGCTHDHWEPFIGIGASIEFGKQECTPTNTCATVATNATNSCGEINNLLQGACPPQKPESFGGHGFKQGTTTQCALSQWAVWLKGGLAFN